MLVVLTVNAAGRSITVKANDRDVVNEPSETVTVIVDAPVIRFTGVTIKVLFAPDPEKVRFALGTRPVLLDIADKVRLPTAVSISPMVKLTPPLNWRHPR